MIRQQAPKIIQKAFTLLLVSALVILPSRGFSDTINLAVASNFMGAAKTLIKDFEAGHPHTVRTSYASSGKFVAQIKHGAPFDIFLAADQKTPRFLAQNKLAKPDSQFTYAIGKLLLCSTTASPNPTEALESLLKASGSANLAFANEKLAPYGFAARQVLERLNIVETPQSKWIRGENVAQAFQFLVSGNAQLAFIASAQVKTKTFPQIKGCQTIPDELYDPIQQDAILLNRGASSLAAQAFIRYLGGPKAQQIIEQHGYRTTTNLTLMPAK